MRRNPLYIFKNLDSVGIYDVPLKSTVQIVVASYDDEGNEIPMFIQLLAKTSLNPDSTIEALLAIPDNYIDLLKVEAAISQLELIEEEGQIGWRIYGRDPEYYGTIGVGAFDFSNSDIVNTKHGSMGDYSFSTGLNTSAWGENSTAVGLETVAGYDNQFILGRWNRNSSNNIFEVGIGTGIGSDMDTYKNAFEIDKEGRLIAPSLNTAMIDNPRSLVTQEFLTNNTSDGELIKIDEGNGFGWRIKGRNVDNYDAIGLNAVDFSYSNQSGNTQGASGERSFATGFNVIQRNMSGAVFGQFNSPMFESIFEIGNGSGTGSIPRSNALEIYADGRIVAPTLETSKIIDAKSLVTKEYLQTSTMEYTLDEIDITNVNINYDQHRIYLTTNPDLNTVEVFNNGLLLREGRDYKMESNFDGLLLTFLYPYVIHIGDWIRVKVPNIKDV